MAGSSTAQTAIPVQGGSYGSITHNTISLDTTTEAITVVAAVTGRQIGAHQVHLQNNSGSNAVTIKLLSGTDLRFQRVLAAGASLELNLQRNPHVIADAGAALKVSATGTTPVVAGVIVTSVARPNFYELV